MPIEKVKTLIEKCKKLITMKVGRKMIVIMKPNATAEQVEVVVKRIKKKD